MSEVINSKHKDRLFTFIYGRAENRKWTLSLYNAINGTAYDNPEDIEINTIENVLYMGMKNDVSLILGDTMSIYEQQSSYNPNMPVRELMYAGRLYDKYIKKHSLNVYGEKQIMLPVPRLVVFYNGIRETEDLVDLELSSSFDEESRDSADISVHVRMININYGHNKELMEACESLGEYSWLIDRIRTYSKDMEVEAAVDKAIDEMRDNAELKPFLEAHRSEVKMSCLTEYDEKKTMQMFADEAREEGEYYHLIDQVIKKVNKGKSVPVIADEVEEDEDVIDGLVKVIMDLDPLTCNAKNVWQIWRRND